MAYDLIAGKTTSRDYSIGAVEVSTSGRSALAIARSAGRTALKYLPFALAGVGGMVIGEFGQRFLRKHRGGRKHVGGLVGGLTLAGSGLALVRSDTYKRAAGWSTGGDDTLGSSPREVAIAAWGKKTGIDPQKNSLAAKEIEKNKFALISRDDNKKRVVWGTVEVADLKNPKIEIDTDRNFKNPKETYYLFDKYSA